MDRASRMAGAGVVTLAACSFSFGVGAQETLPEIVVTSPSPILARPTTPQPPGFNGPAIGVLPVIDTTFSPVTVVTRDDIVREPQRSLGDLLFEKPGISASTFAPGIASRPIVRGLDNARVRIQENGIGVQDVSELGEDHAVPIDPLTANQIEVLRGPATLRYGSGSIGGVVSAINNRIPSFIPANGVTGQITGGVSSVDRGRDGSAQVDGGGGGVAVHADAFGRQAQDYSTPQGRQVNSALDVHGQSVGASVIGTSGFIGLAFQHYDALYHVPGGADAVENTRLQINQDKITSRAEIRPDTGPIEALRFSFGISRYKHNEIGIGDDGIDAIQATFRNREYEARIEAQHVPVFTALGTLTGALGVQFDRRNLDTSGEAGSLLRPTESRQAAIYLFEELAVTDTFKLQAAGRFEGTRAVGTSPDFPGDFVPTGDPLVQLPRAREFSPMSASLGALQKLPYGFVASLNGNYAERAPTSFELYSQGAHDATETFEIGNPNLKKEIARSVEIGIRKAEGPWRLDATGYYTRYTGFIYKRFTGLSCGDDFDSCGVEDENRQINYSQRNATFYGAEISSQLDIIPIGPGFVGLDAQYDFVHAQFDDGTYVPRIPPHRAGAGIFYRDPNWFARVGFLHAFDHTQIGEFETLTPGYTLLKAEVSYRQRLDPNTFGFQDITVAAIGDNLLNDDVRNSASFKKDEILLPGRNVRLSVTARF